MQLFLLMKFPGCNYLAYNYRSCLAAQYQIYQNNERYWLMQSFYNKLFMQAP